MIERIIGIDHSITLFLDSVQTPFWNSVMLFFSSNTAWIPMYVLIAVALFIPRCYGRKSLVGRQESGIVPFWAAGLLTVALAAACFGATDQITNVIKNLFERPRPGHDPLLEGLLNLPEGRGGKYSFVSAHAANTMAFAVLTSLILRRKWYTYIIVIWAVIVGFSRIYLSKHFMTDVICGFLLGIAIGLLFYWLYKVCFKFLTHYYHKKKCSVS